MKTAILMSSVTLMYSWEMKPGKLIDNAVLYALCGSCVIKDANSRCLQIKQKLGGDFKNRTILTDQILFHVLPGSQRAYVKALVLVSH